MYSVDFFFRDIELHWLFSFARIDLITRMYVQSFRTYVRTITAANKIYFHGFSGFVWCGSRVSQRAATIAFQLVNRYRVVRFSLVTLSKRKSICIVWSALSYLGYRCGAKTTRIDAVTPILSRAQLILLNRRYPSVVNDSRREWRKIN